MGKTDRFRPLHREVEPAAAGLLGALLYVLLVVVLLDLASGCNHYARPGKTRLPSEQDASAVALRTFCEVTDAFEASGAILFNIHMGTGTLVDSSHVLTAHHVIDCASGDAVVDARTADGRTLRMTVQKDDIGADLALLVALKSPGKFTPAKFGPHPLPGQQVCASSAFPARVKRCGPVISSDAGGITIGIDVIPGNSGSGLYDGRGRLVGVVTAGWFKPDGTPWGKGFAVPLDVHPLVWR